MARRHGKVWTATSGWVETRATDPHDYSKYDERTLKIWAFLIWVWRWFPDKLLDLTRSEEADYPNEELLQRVIIRAFARYRDVSITGARGMTKTTTKMKYALVHNAVWPGIKSVYYGPSYKQLAEIGSNVFRQIEHDYPALAAEWRVAAESKDDFKLETDTGSTFHISAIRGGNLHDSTAEEYAQEEHPQFDHKAYEAVVKKSVRLLHIVNGAADPNFVAYKNHTITSAGRKQNPAFQARCDVLRRMIDGDSAFAMDVSWESVVLQQMRPMVWARTQRNGSSIDVWMREMESRWTGADENPVLSDETLTESQNIMVMEREHCCKSKGNKLDPKDVIYVIGYDVSYATGVKNAKCAIAVLKLTKQKEFLRKDRYLKQLVYLDDWPPPGDAKVQALRVKEIWRRFCYDGGAGTYIAVDAWQYGSGVFEDLMKDLEDGNPPLCVRNHTDFVHIELPGAIPCLYPVKAGSSGQDSDWQMVKYAQTEFEHHNVELLTLNANAGVEAYKQYHKIKDDDSDFMIAKPYQKTRELSGQIQNLKLVPSGAGMSEKRISKHIQRDSWSALKYALHFAHILELQELVLEVQGKKGDDWTELLRAHEGGRRNIPAGKSGSGRLVTARRGGRLF